MKIESVIGIALGVPFGLWVGWNVDTWIGALKRKLLGR